MKNLKYILVFSFLLHSSCSGLIGDGSDESIASTTGTIVPSSDVITFSASFGDSTYHSMGFNNSTGEIVKLTRVAFANNLCNDFSVYNITNTSGTVLADNNDSLSINVGAGQKVNINIRYSPSSCIYSNYDALLYVYYTRGTTTEYLTVTLKPATTSGDGPFACDEIDIEKSSKYIETSFSGTVPDGTYFLRVDRMRAYIHAPASGGSVTEDALALGTDINGLDPEDYIQAYLSATVTGSQFNLDTIENADDFCLPSPDDNFFFLGASTLLTTSQGVVGSIDADGNVETGSLNVTIRAEHIPLGPTVDLANSDRIFQISLLSQLTTAITPATIPDSQPLIDGLRAASNQTDDSGNELLPIEDGANGAIYLTGSSLKNGQMTLVGVGTFTNEENSFVGADIAKTFMIESEAYIYMVMDITVMQAAP